ncbi:3808_t:CDS:1, partial [Acaulospora morrowiae]
KPMETHGSNTTNLAILTAYDTFNSTDNGNDNYNDKSSRPPESMELTEAC